MDFETLKLTGNLCRCCHAKGRFFYNLGTPCGKKNRKTTYKDTLYHVFDINLPQVTGPLSMVTYTICKECSRHLLDVARFKDQVLKCEERFMLMYEKNLIVAEAGVEIKEENAEEDGYVKDSPKQDTIDYDDDDDVDGRFDDKEYSITNPEIKIEIELEENAAFKRNLRKKCQTKQVPQQAKKRQIKKRKPKKNEEMKKTEVQIELEETEKEAGAEKEREAQKELEADPIKRKSVFRIQPKDYKIDGDDIICNHCDRKFRRKEKLRHHLKRMHYKLPQFSCPICKKGFATIPSLTVHKLNEHNVDERVKCNACDGLFNTIIQLKRHKNTFHMLGVKYKCDLCDYESYSTQSLYKHKFKHKTIKDHLCKFCNKSFVRKTTLQLHERIHTGDRRKVCKVCGLAFVQKASLNYHMIKHHPGVSF